MEGGQKYPIPLDSGLDVKASDQLVNVSHPLFQHNRQRFQGSMLPTSLRYEHNGWACGWDIYEFEVDVTSVDTDPVGYTVIRTKLNANPTYIFRVRSGTTTYVQIWYNAEDTDLTGGLSISHDANNYHIVTISGDNDGHEFAITIDIVTGDISCDESSGWYVEESAYEEAIASSGIATLNLTDLDSWVQLNAAIIEAEDAKYGSTVVATYYSCDGTKHVWKNAVGSGWEISYDTESGECLVNGEPAESNDPSNDYGRLAISYDTEYVEDIALRVSCEEFYFQITDPYSKQTTSYIDTSNVSTETFGNWSVSTSGDKYIYPVSQALSGVIISGYVPTWCGLSLEYATGAGAVSTDFVELSAASGFSLVPESSVFSVICGLLSCETMMLYTGALAAGYEGKIWIGETECNVDDYGSLDGDDSYASQDITASFTYCACVFNRIAINEEQSDLYPYDYPFTAGVAAGAVDDDGSNCYVSTEEKAVWLDSFSAKSKSGEDKDFEAGFYMPVAYYDKDGADKGWYLAPDGEAHPDLYPNSYSEDDIVGSGDYDGYVRLGFPYASYDIEVECEPYSGGQYICTSKGASDIESTMGQACIDIAILLTNTVYTDALTGDVYVLGESGYLLPYFYSTENGSGKDTRVLSGVVSTSDGETVQGSWDMTIDRGPFAGCTLTMSIYEETATYGYYGKFTGLSQYYSTEKRLLTQLKETYAEQGWTYSGMGSRGWWAVVGLVMDVWAYFYKLKAKFSLSIGGTTIKTFTDDSEGSLSDYLGYFGITPLCAYYKAVGCGDTGTLSTSSKLWISACFPGYFQQVLSLKATGSDYTFTSDSLLEMVTIEDSTYSSLIHSDGLYVDRVGDNSSGGECTYFGMEMLQLNVYSANVSGGQATLRMYLSPADDSESGTFYLQSGSDADCYIPGQVYYGDADRVGQGYNLSASNLGSTYSSSALTFSVIGDVVAFYRVSSMSRSWVKEDGIHAFYEDCLPSAVSSLSVSGTVFGSATNTGKGNASATQVANLVFGGESVQVMLSFLLSGGSASTTVYVSGGTRTIEYRGYSFTFVVDSYVLGDVSNSITLSVSVPLHYDLTARLPYQYNYENSLTYEGGKYYEGANEHGDLPVGSYATGYDYYKQLYSFLANGLYSYTYSNSTKEVTYGTTAYDTEPVGYVRKIELDVMEALELSFILQGAYKISKGEIVSFDDSSITFEYNDTEYTFDFADLMSDESSNSLDFMYTDTTDDSAVPQSVTFATQDTTSEYQFLRQAWNTLTEVENYWWIDDSTILELNKTSLTVKRKVSSLDSYDSDTDVDVDDWGGDAWVDAYSFDRGDYLDNTVARYGVTCAYGGEAPRFWTVKLASTTSVQITFYELKCESDYSYSFEKVTVSVSVNVVSIGSELNASELSLNTYSQLSAGTIIYEAKYSGTVIDGHVLFGIHLDNNFNQWALDISSSGDLNAVVQGYGFVGLDGCLTGGEIPSSFFDATKGFDGTVMSIDTLEQEDIDYVDSMSDFLALDADGTVVGDESQQWYISKSLSGIVSHLTWNGDSWDTVTLPITNTYSSCYGSPSYGERIISDYSFWSQSLSKLMNDDGFQSAVSDLTGMLNVLVNGFSPKVTTAMYLQQTMGQYAYVHYNSASPGKQKDLTREDDSENIFGDYGVSGTSYTAIGSARSKKEEPIEAVSPENSDDFTFNLHGIRQSVAVTKPWSGDYALMLVIMSALSSLSSTLSNVLDTVKVNAKEGKVNIGMKGSEMSQFFLQNMASLAITDLSVIGVLPELQSAVSSACSLDMFYSTSEGQKVRAGPGWVQHNMVAQCVAQSVTSCQWEMQQIGMLWILDGLSSISSKLAYETARIVWETLCEEASVTKEATAMSTNYGWLIAAGLILGGGVAYAVCAVNKTLSEITDALIRSICGGTAKVEVQNASSKHTYDVEGKHKYGTKSEVFMWPCFGVDSDNTYTDEVVEAVLSEHNWGLHVPLYSGQAFIGGLSDKLGTVSLEGVLGSERQDDDVISSFDGDILYQIANCKGTQTSTTLPSDMAVVTGADTFLPPVPFRNGNIGVSEPQFPTPCFQDYIIDKDWELSRTASDGWTTWISCKDTKLIDGEASNIVVSDDFCGVAAPYVAIEVKRGCEQKYIRPWAITPNALALNQTGYNCCYDRKAYHAFDGYGQRIVKWCGSSGMNKEGVAYQYAFIVNDRFKRSNRIFRNEFFGNFKGDPTIALSTTGDDWVYNHVTFPGPEPRGLEVGAIGEDKDTERYALPVFSELVSTLPAVVKTISSSNLSVIDGITSLTTDNRDLQSAYKAPTSVDFAIGENKYRFTEEYLCELKVDQQAGVTVVEHVVPTLGLTFLGATPYVAYLYSQATRQYYTFEGGSSLNAVDTLERFRDVLFGRYDFVNQEVALPCVATFERLDKHVHDDEDERDNVIVPRLKGSEFVGEVSPPLETIYNTGSGFRTLSLPSGLCYQGPNRCIINRFVYSDYMKEQIKENYGKWKRVPREKYHPFRDYSVEYERVDESLESDLVGWTHNQFLLVTSPLGASSETDCMFEWEITFAWPVEMDELYGCGQYATVNVLGECFTPGGKVIPDRPVHVFLWKDLFTRTGNYGYYSFRYQSMCGAGNRERLHIWSDQYIAVSGLQVDVKPVTEKRTEVLTQQVDVMEMEEI